MAKWVVWRLLRTGVAVWAIASALFLLGHRDATSFDQLALPDATDLTGHATGQAAARAGIRQRLGLDGPVFYFTYGQGAWHWHGTPNQYHRWLGQLLRGDLGRSFRTGQPVTERLAAALRYTVPLTGTALVLAAAAALALGQRLAARPWWQGPVRSLLAGLQALPLFLVALALLLLLANPEVLAWFPAQGADAGWEPDQGLGAALGRYAWHLALPVAALVLMALPELTLQLDAALAQELRTGYATTARAKGLAQGAVVRRHALRNALLPSIAQLADMLPALVAGAVVVEVIFALPGMGRLLAGAAMARDYPVLLGGVLLTGAARLLALALADLCYHWADPRIRWQP